MIPAIFRSGDSRRRKIQSRYDGHLQALSALDLPCDRAARLEAMAACTDAMRDLEQDEQTARDQHEAAGILRQAAAAERGYVLIPGGEDPRAHDSLWADLALSEDHGERAFILRSLADRLGISGYSRDVLAAVARTEDAAARLTAGRP